MWESHRGIVVDSDKYFEIDPVTRQIKPLQQKTSLVQFDHNSERFTFTIPRYVEGHDMSGCTKVEIHYVNVDANTKEEVPGLYVVDDLHIDEQDGNAVICTWLISQNATQRVGLLKFNVRFICTDPDGTLYYSWGTGIYQSITIAPGIYNTDIIIEQYADIIEQWQAEIKRTYQPKDFIMTASFEIAEDNVVTKIYNISNSFSDIKDAHALGRNVTLFADVSGFPYAFKLPLYGISEEDAQFIGIDAGVTSVRVQVNSSDVWHASVVLLATEEQLKHLEDTSNKVQEITELETEKEAANKYVSVAAAREYVTRKLTTLAGSYYAKELVAGITA